MLALRSLRLRCVGGGNGSGRPRFGPSEKKILGRQDSRSSMTAEFLNFSISASLPLENKEGKHGNVDTDKTIGSNVLIISVAHLEDLLG